MEGDDGRIFIKDKESWKAARLLMKQSLSVSLCVSVSVGEGEWRIMMRIMITLMSKLRIKKMVTHAKEEEERGDGQEEETEGLEEDRG